MLISHVRIEENWVIQAAGPACVSAKYVYVDDSGSRLKQLVAGLGGEGAQPARGPRYGLIQTPLDGTDVSGTGSFPGY